MSINRLFDRAYRDYVADGEVLRILNIIILSVAVGTFLFTAQLGIAFTGYISALGAGEFVFGVVSAMPVIAGLLQIPASYLAQKSGKYKQMFLIGGLLQRISWLVIAFIPFLFPVEGSQIWALVVLVTLGAMGGSFIAITHMTLFASVVPADIRGRYITTRHKVTTVCGIISGLCIAFMLDNMPGFYGYTLVFAIGGIAGIIDILMYTGVKFSSIPKKTDGYSLMNGIRGCFTSKRMRNFLIYWTYWFFVVNLTAPYFGLYAIDVLGLSFTSIIVLGTIVAQALTLLVVSKWGVFLDRYGSVPTLMIAATTASVTMSAWLFAVPGSVVPIIVFNFFGGIFWCAIDACFINMQITHTPTEDRPTTLAIFALFTSGAAAVALITGGALLEVFYPVMNRLDFTFFGTPFDNFKLLFAIGIVLRFTGIIIFLPKVWNEKEMTNRSAYAMAYDEASYRVRYELSRLRFPRRRDRE